MGRSEDDFVAVEFDRLHIESHVGERVDPLRMGFGDTNRFAIGFRTVAQELARGSSPEVAIEGDDSVSYGFLVTGTQRCRAVCKIEARGVNYRGERGRWSGTGFLVAPNILLTNQHVINTKEVAAVATAVFDYQEVRPGVMDETSRFGLDPNRLFVASPYEELDYCFVWIDGRPQESFGSIEFWRGSFMATTGDRANIIHHPNGHPKRVSLKKNEIVDLGLEEILVHYTSDTEPGSSGSPVMNDEWRLYALHHASSGTLSPQLRRRVKASGYESAVLNEGIKTAAIAMDIERKASEACDGAMAQEVQSHIMGHDSRTGYFGALGRPMRGSRETQMVMDGYLEGGGDIDVAFWDLESIGRNDRRNIHELARIVADLNLDVWVLKKAAPDVTVALVATMRTQFDLAFEHEVLEPRAGSNDRRTIVVWNGRSVKCERVGWSPAIDEGVESGADGEVAGAPDTKGDEGLDRSLRVLRFRALSSGRVQPGLHIDLVPLEANLESTGAEPEGFGGDALATTMSALRRCSEQANDWVIDGRLDVESSQERLRELSDAGFAIMGANNEQGGGITYVKRSDRSCIESIFLSPDLACSVDATGLSTSVPNRSDAGYPERVSIGRPMMIRFSSGTTSSSQHGQDIDRRAAADDGGDDPLLRDFLVEFDRDPASTLESLARLMRDR